MFVFLLFMNYFWLVKQLCLINIIHFLLITSPTEECLEIEFSFIKDSLKPIILQFEFSQFIYFNR